MAMIQKRMEVTDELAGRADRVAQILSESVSAHRFAGSSITIASHINEAPCKTTIGATVKRGDTVRIELRHPSPLPSARKGMQEDDGAFPGIVFEDEHLIVVDKAAGVLTVPANPGETDSLLHAVFALSRASRREEAGRSWFTASTAARRDCWSSEKREPSLKRCARPIRREKARARVTPRSFTGT